MINGVPTSTAALLGETGRGATKPSLVTSINDYRRRFGSPLPGDKYLADAVEGFFLNGGRRVCISRIVAPDAGTATSAVLPVAAVGPGQWGNGIFARIAPSGQVGRFDLSIACFEALSGRLSNDPFDDPALLATADVVEAFENLDLADTLSPDHWTGRLEESVLVRPVDRAFAPHPVEVQVIRLEGVGDGRMVVAADYEGEPSDEEPTGLAALDQSTFDEVSLIAAPGLSDPDMLTKLCRHCEQKRFRFAVLDGPRSSEDFAQLNPQARWDTSNAAYYVPWLPVSRDLSHRAGMCSGCSSAPTQSAASGRRQPTSS
jgi:hypothetical protein